MPKVWARRKPRGPARSAELTTKPSAGANGPLLVCFHYLTQSSLSLRAFRIRYLPFSEQTPSVPNIECELPRGRKTGGLRNRDEMVGTGFDGWRTDTTGLGGGRWAELTAKPSAEASDPVTRYKTCLPRSTRRSRSYFQANFTLCPSCSSW